MEKELYSLILLAVVISFFGFVLENTWLLCTKGFIDNRNMRFPFLWGYGLAVTTLYCVLGVPAEFEMEILNVNFNGYTAYFIIAFIIISLGEIIMGFFTEKYFGFYYWNYERLPLHITRYTSVPTSIGFSVILTLFMDKCFCQLWELLNEIPLAIVKPVSVIMAVVLTYDLVKSFSIMHHSGKLYIRYVKYPKRKNEKYLNRI